MASLTSFFGSGNYVSHARTSHMQNILYWTHPCPSVVACCFLNFFDILFLHFPAWLQDPWGQGYCCLAGDARIAANAVARTTATIFGSATTWAAISAFPLLQEQYVQQQLN